MEKFVAIVRASVPYGIGATGGIAYHAFMHPAVKQFIGWLNTLMNG